MAKDPRLVNIYLKIHNKKVITMDDLAYLAKYEPECFEKTCKNVVYNFPASKPVVDPPVKEEPKEETFQAPDIDWKHIDVVLNNLKRLEADDFPITGVDSERVKNLLGNLYMELLYPHNDKETFIELPDPDQLGRSLFDKKI